jgi:hypothetical protein
MLKGIDGIYGVGPQQPPQNNAIPQFQNPYSAPTIINPYSLEDRRQFGFQIPHQLQMNQQRPDPNTQQQRPDPYQMYGGLGSLFRMQDAYSQRPGPITQEQSNEANRRLMEKYKTAAQQQAQQPAQQQAQQVVQQQYTQPAGNQAMWDGGQGG